MVFLVLIAAQGNKLAVRDLVDLRVFVFRRAKMKVLSIAYGVCGLGMLDLDVANITVLAVR